MTQARGATETLRIARQHIWWHSARLQIPGPESSWASLRGAGHRQAGCIATATHSNYRPSQTSPTDHQLNWALTLWRFFSDLQRCWCSAKVDKFEGGRSGWAGDEAWRKGLTIHLTCFSFFNKLMKDFRSRFHNNVFGRKQNFCSILFVILTWNGHDHLGLDQSR